MPKLTHTHAHAHNHTHTLGPWTRQPTGYNKRGETVPVATQAEIQAIRAMEEAARAELEADANAGEITVVDVRPRWLGADAGTGRRRVTPSAE